ncbi:MAG: hypothetical protein HC798_01550 [Polaribacter sp.]|nr:hypothetical protein [Polaribacter sp.]
MLFHHTLKREFNVININNNSSFNALGYLPVDDESLYISKLNKNGSLLPAELYIQSNPLNIPQLNINSDQLIFKPNYYNSENFVNDKIITNSIKKPQLLDEIVIKANKEKERLERIKNSRFGTVYFLMKKQITGI